MAPAGLSLTRLSPLPLACLAQAISTVKAASKPAGLAAPAPAAEPGAGLPARPGARLTTPMTHGYSQECLSQGQLAMRAAPKTAGLAKLAPVGAIRAHAGSACISTRNSWLACAETRCAGDAPRFHACDPIGSEPETRS